MRIFYASHDPGNSVPQSKTWYNNLYLPLCDIAEEVIRFDYDLFPICLHQDFRIATNKEIIDYHKPRIEKELISQIETVHKKSPIDLFFSYFASSYCSPEIIRKIGEMGITTVNWFCNASYQFYLVEEIATAYHYCLVPEKFRLEDYRRVGANPIYCQEAANPNIYKPYNIEKEIDISFLGQRYADRYKYIRDLHNAGLKIKVFGENWKPQNPKGVLKKILRPIYNIARKDKPVPASAIGGYISDEEMVKVYSRSKINLGFANCYSSPGEEPIKQVRLRDFEVPMSGGFYLTEYFEELADFFVPDKEIVCFTDAKDCIDKAKYYLDHSQEREEIRLAGHQRALKDHSWQKRLRDVFGEMGYSFSN